MIPADLLDKLREKDPELWDKLNDRLAGSLLADLRIAHQYSERLQFLIEAIIQAELQEAIRARGWGYQMLLFRNPTVYEAYIVGNRETISRGDTEAEALLQAYLSALSASQ